MTIGQERIARQNDILDVWHQMGNLLVDADPVLYAKVAPLVEEMFGTIERARTDAIDRAAGEAFRLGRARGREEAEREWSRTADAKDEIIATLGFMALQAMREDPELISLIQAVGRTYAIDESQRIVQDILEQTMSTSALTDEYGADRPSGIEFFKYELRRAIDRANE